MCIQSRYLYISGLAFSIVIAASFLASCTAPNDLSAIQQYASVTAQSADSFAAVATDYAASCERWQTVARGIVETSFSPEAATLVTNRPQLLQFIIPNASPNPGYTAPPTQEANPAPAPASTAAAAPAPNPSDCSTAKSVSTSWNDANSAILDYVQALGNLAGVDTVPTPNPAPLVSGLTAAGVSSAATQAVSGLISAIGSYFLNRLRDREITSFLQAVNPNFPGTIEALEHVDADYTKRLKLEYTATITQYDGYAGDEISHANATCPPQRTAPCRQRTAARLLRTKSVVEASLAAINKNLQASADYGAAMESILATHQQLYAASLRGASFQDYLKIVQTTVLPVITNLQGLAKAVK